MFLNNGYLFSDKLTLKIPWKNLYNDPVLIEVDGVYIVAGPETGIYCNA